MLLRTSTRSAVRTRRRDLDPFAAMVEVQAGEILADKTPSAQRRVRVYDGAPLPVELPGVCGKA